MPDGISHCLLANEWAYQTGELKAGKIKIGDSPNQDMIFSNTLNDIEGLQDGHQMTVKDSVNELLKITRFILPSICRSEDDQYESPIVAHEAEWIASKVQ